MNITSAKIKCILFGTIAVQQLVCIVESTYAVIQYYGTVTSTLSYHQ